MLFVIVRQLRFFYPKQGSLVLENLSKPCYGAALPKMAYML